MMMIWWWEGRCQCVCSRMRMVQSREDPSLIHRPMTLSEDVDHNTQLWLLSRACIKPSSCVLNPWNPSIRPCSFHLNSYFLFNQSVLCLVRGGRGFEGRQVGPSTIHRNACNAQHLNAPPPKLVYHHHHHHHLPISHPTHPNLQPPHPLTPIHPGEQTGPKPTWNIDLICVKIGSTLSAQSPRPFSSLNSPFT